MFEFFRERVPIAGGSFHPIKGYFCISIIRNLKILLTFPTNTFLSEISLVQLKWSKLEYPSDENTKEIKNYHSDIKRYKLVSSALHKSSTLSFSKGMLKLRALFLEKEEEKKVKGPFRKC